MDPLRIGPHDRREQLALDFLIGILPQPVDPQWRLETASAIRRVTDRGGRNCAAVVDDLSRGGHEAREAARAIQRLASRGLPRLGLARPGDEPPEPGANRITSLRVRDLKLPIPGADARGASPQERISSLIMRLMAAYALWLAAAQNERHCVIGIDEASVLTMDAAGVEFVAYVLSSSRSENVTPLIASQAIDRTSALADLFGAAFCFRIDGDEDIPHTCRVLHAGERMTGHVRRLEKATPGRCLMRDYNGRVAAVQIDFADDRLLPILDTTPTRSSATSCTRPRGADGH